MTGDGRRRSLAAVALAVAVAGAIVMARAPSPSHPAASTAGPRVQAVPPQRTPPTLPLDTRRALIVARRFASAYASWDAGRRDRPRSRRLARVTTTALFAALSRYAARPVARGPRILTLRPMAAYPAGGGSFVVPLLERAGPYVMTLVVVPTTDGARVARLQR
jgi:hypothetical protein